MNLTSANQTHGREALDVDAILAAAASDVRMTPHRREVYKVLMESHDHPTANDVYARVKDRSPGISMATVYNCLDHLTSHGLVKQVNVERSQSRFCANLHDHVHFHCEGCGRVVDADPKSELSAESIWRLPDGARVTRMDIAIHGLCPDCATKRRV